MNELDFPFRIDERGRSARTDDADHVRDLIELVLFTAPGERVNRPDFGSGLRDLVFTPNSPEVAATTQFLVQGALQRWLGDIIDVSSVEAESSDSRLEVTVRYTLRRTLEEGTARFSREA